MNKYRKNLALSSFDIIPKENPNAKKIIALIKEKNKIIGYLLEDNTSLSKDEAIDYAKLGKIKHVGIAHNKNTTYLKSLPDTSYSNNLSSLPSITK